MNTLKRFVRTHTIGTTCLLTITGYVLVIGSLYSDAFSVLYPDLSRASVNIFSHLIAANNFLATICLGLGWWYIRAGDTDRHPKWMTAGFALILLFLVLYLIKTGGGGRKEFVGPSGPKIIYLFMLGTHILLSIAAVPLVLYTLLLGWTRSIPEISSTPHPNVGPYAAGSWIISLMLGLVAYVLLNHVYAFEFVAR